MALLDFLQGIGKTSVPITPFNPNAPTEGADLGGVDPTEMGAFGASQAPAQPKKEGLLSRIMATGDDGVTFGDKLYAVPFEALKVAKNVDDNAAHFTLNMTQERLKNAPGFAKEEWPNFSDERFVVRLYDFYGVEHRTGFRPRHDDRVKPIDSRKHEGGETFDRDRNKVDR